METPFSLILFFLFMRLNEVYKINVVRFRRAKEARRLIRMFQVSLLWPQSTEFLAMAGLMLRKPFRGLLLTIRTRLYFSLTECTWSPVL